MAVNEVARERAIASIAEAIDPKRVATELMEAMDKSASEGGERQAWSIFTFPVNDPATRKLMCQLERKVLERHLMTAIHRFFTEDVTFLVRVYWRPRWFVPLRFRVFADRESYYLVRAMHRYDSKEQ